MHMTCSCTVFNCIFHMLFVFVSSPSLLFWQNEFLIAITVFINILTRKTFIAPIFFFENSRIACRFCFLRATNHCFHSCLPALLILMICHDFFVLSLCNCTHCFPEQFDVMWLHKCRTVRFTPLFALVITLVSHTFLWFHVWFNMLWTVFKEQ